MSLDSMKLRLQKDGGLRKDRLVKTKLKSMLSAAQNGYHGGKFQKLAVDDIYDGLFNPVANNENFDTKMISIPFEAKFSPGTVFKWKETDTRWIVFLRDLTELAYFRGKCRRCDYDIRWVDQNKKVVEIPVSVIGPEGQANRRYTGQGIALEMPTATVEMLAADTELHREFFLTTNQRILLRGRTYRVHQVDDLSMPGILQIFATQDKTDLVENDREENLSNAWNVLPVLPEGNPEMISGPQSVKPYFEAQFKAATPGGVWSILEEKLPIKMAIRDDSAVVVWRSTKRGTYTLQYTVGGTVHKYSVAIESLM